MSSRFVPLTPRVGAKATVSREEILDPAFAEECRDALGVLWFCFLHDQFAPPFERVHAASMSGAARRVAA